ncbi:serine threonine- kinase 2 19-like [Olea europaea subsp. europaea]|uniref:non-specific serine/threonine protein kinase n=1 Tax=Olea europaea subsp. europaea TaxID=158383 RepID=A0A8S0QIG8_OLEEU|nr:serine threonine- kinase 2 19-like [Olea europaea subsp. europaea]
MVELDFSDVFGLLPIQAPNELIDGTSGTANVTELVYNDPEVIYNRSHSLVGPSTCISQSLKLSGLAIHETEDPIEIVEYVTEETRKEDQELSVKDSVDEDVDVMKVKAVGLEDFEVLKVVGQGAFGKVHQVRKKGTSEIYAMKVMRKDKIMEKNHAEYMKAERDILSQIDHPL